ncbi:hypothetical protein FSP39_015571 [Pinctada imbricata]|uniref:Major facilitator superfamily (MFS) profile domain-containing protein n=1 Tax=Pinctada imbricata TaxID=66713 RepID=A0AA89BRB3_PINIB|nr:hypothetical protein FSP39_015571 [Pinctada imbricata]
MEAELNTETTPRKSADEQSVPETESMEPSNENTDSNIAQTQPSIGHKDQSKNEKLSTEHNGRETLSLKPSNDSKEPPEATPTKEEYDNPVDQGWSWMILISAFLICLLTIGGIKSFGVLLVELSRQYDLPKSLLSLIQSLTGFFFLSLGPVSNALSMKYSFQKMTIIGGIFTSLGLILTSFAKSVEVIFITYGILTGAGFGLSFSPSMVFLAHHFKKRRALANGIALSGGGMGSMVLPYLMRFLIDKFSLQGCMLILSAIMAHIIVCGALFRPLYKYPRKPIALQMVVMNESDQSKL